jgi:hypothetical protein
MKKQEIDKALARLVEQSGAVQPKRGKKRRMLSDQTRRARNRRRRQSAGQD